MTVKWRGRWRTGREEDSLCKAGRLFIIRGLRYTEEVPQGKG